MTREAGSSLKVTITLANSKSSRSRTAPSMSATAASSLTLEAWRTVHRLCSQKLIGTRKTTCARAAVLRRLATGKICARSMVMSSSTGSACTAAPPLSSIAQGEVAFSALHATTMPCLASLR